MRTAKATMKKSTVVDANLRRMLSAKTGGMGHRLINDRVTGRTRIDFIYHVDTGEIKWFPANSDGVGPRHLKGDGYSAGFFILDMNERQHRIVYTDYGGITPQSRATLLETERAWNTRAFSYSK